MKKTLTLLSLWLVSFLVAWAGPVSKEQALEIATRYLSPSSLRLWDGSIVLDKTVYTTGSLRSGEATVAFYVFNKGSNEGFVVVSGDDRMWPVLAYSHSGSLNMDDLPAPAADWLKYLQAQASLLPTDHTPARLFTIQPKGEVVVAPLLEKEQINWGQVAPHNKYTPISDVMGNCPTGCVATAASQIMRYHKWPKKGRGSHSYTDPYDHYREANFETEYRWDLMPGYVGTSREPGLGISSEQEEALSILQHHVGVSVEMQYTAGGSGAMSFRVVQAAKQYFDYSPAMHSHLRSFYNIDEWHQLIKEELDQQCPVFHTGAYDHAGHAFVCDGYTSDEFFHFNWGWYGDANGYYRLEALVPQDIGVGGGDFGIYNEHQMIIKNFVPNGQGPEKEARPDIAGSIYYKYDKNSKNIHVWACVVQEHELSIEGQVSIGIRNMKTNQLALSKEFTYRNIVGNNYITDDLVYDTVFDLSGLPTGTYSVESYVRLPHETEPVRTQPFDNYPYTLIIKVQEDGEIAIEWNEDRAILEYIPGSIKSNLYAYTDGTVSVLVKNVGKRYYWGELKLVPEEDIFMDDIAVSLFDCIQPGETKEVTFYVSGLLLMPGEYAFNLQYKVRPDEDWFIYSTQEDVALDKPDDEVLVVTRKERYEVPTFVVQTEQEKHVIDCNQTSATTFQIPGFIISNWGTEGEVDFDVVMASRSGKLKHFRYPAVSISTDGSYTLRPEVDISGFSNGIFRIHLFPGDKSKFFYGTPEFLVDIQGEVAILTPQVNRCSWRQTTDGIEVQYPEGVHKVALYSTTGMLLYEAYTKPNKETISIRLSKEQQEPMLLLLFDPENQVVESAKILPLKS